MQANHALGATDLLPTSPVTLGILTHLENHKAILYKVACMYRRDREERQDLVQEMVIQLWRFYEHFDNRVQFST